MTAVESIEKSHYYVYQCEVDGVVRYIGKGSGVRLNHCVAGISNIFELNRDFFTGKDMTVYKVAENLSERDAFALESELIEKSVDTLYNKYAGKALSYNSRIKSLYGKSILNIKVEDLPNGGINVPEEIMKYIDEALTEDSLKRRIIEIDHKIRTAVSKVDYQFIVGMVCRSEVTKTETALISYLSSNLSGWNYHINTMQGLCSGAGIEKTNISKIISSLTPNLLVVTHKDKPSKGCVVLKINPIIAWRGDLSYREPAIQSWYTNNNISKSK